MLRLLRHSAQQYQASALQPLVLRGLSSISDPLWPQQPTSKPSSLLPSQPSPRRFSTSTPGWMSGGAPAPRKPTTGDGQPPPPPEELDPLQDSSMGLVQRFKRTMKQYSKVVIPVHLITSAVWCGSFYYAAMKGVNVVPVLEYIPGFPERLIKLLENSQSGYALTSYALYKIATPARYAVTMGGTSLSVKYLRRHGYMSTPPPVKEYLQDKMEETRERITERMEETKERLTERMEETKDKFAGRLQETKDKVAFRKKNE